MNHHYVKGVVAAKSVVIALTEERLHPVFRFPRATIQAVQRLGRDRAIARVLAWRHPGTNATVADADRYIGESLAYFKRFELNKEH